MLMAGCWQRQVATGMIPLLAVGSTTVAGCMHSLNQAGTVIPQSSTGTRLLVQVPVLRQLMLGGSSEPTAALDFNRPAARPQRGR